MRWREPSGPGTVNVCPHSHYPTKDGKWIAIACTSDKIYARLAEAQGQPELAAPGGKWKKIADRDRERDDVDAWVARWTMKFALDECIAECDKFQVPCGPVYSISDIFRDPHYAAGETSCAWTTSASAARSRCRNVLKLTDAEMGKLKDKGVI